MPDYKTTRLTSIDWQDFLQVWTEGKTTFMGNFPFALWPHLDTDAKKQNHILAIYLDLVTRPDGIVWESRLDGKIVALNAGTLITDPKKGPLIQWEVALLGYEPDGTRSWLEADWATAERARFWAELGVNGWRQKVYDKGDNTIVRHYENNAAKEGAKGNTISQTRRDEVPGFSSVDIDVVKE